MATACGCQRRTCRRPSCLHAVTIVRLFITMLPADSVPFSLQIQPTVFLQDIKLDLSHPYVEHAIFFAGCLPLPAGLGLWFSSFLPQQQSPSPAHLCLGFDTVDQRCQFYPFELVSDCLIFCNINKIDFITGLRLGISTGAYYQSPMSQQPYAKAPCQLSPT